MSRESEKRTIIVELTADEALVLSDWLWRMDQTGALEPHFQHWAEQLAVWRMEGSLDRTLVEPFDPTYDTLVSAARERLTANNPESASHRADSNDRHDERKGRPPK